MYHKFLPQSLSTTGFVFLGCEPTDVYSTNDTNFLAFYQSFVMYITRANTNIYWTSMAITKHFINTNDCSFLPSGSHVSTLNITKLSHAFWGFVKNVWEPQRTLWEAVILHDCQSDAVHWLLCCWDSWICLLGEYSASSWDLLLCDAQGLLAFGCQCLHHISGRKGAFPVSL